MTMGMGGDWYVLEVFFDFWDFWDFGLCVLGHLFLNGHCWVGTRGEEGEAWWSLIVGSVCIQGV